MTEPKRTAGAGDSGHLRRVRLAGVLTASGLLVELLTFRWAHPFGFMTMLALGGGLIIAGVALFLVARLVDHPGR